MKRRCIIIMGVLASAITSVLALTLGLAQGAEPQRSLAPQPASRAVSASACGAIEIPLDMGDPFAVAYNPVNDYVYVVRSGVTLPRAVALYYGREVTRTNFLTGGYRELTSVGVNPHSGLVYVTQWSSDMVHFISGTQGVGLYSTGDWGPAGVWPSPLSDDTYVSGKWVASTSKVARLTGTVFQNLTGVGYNANPNAGVVAENNQYLYLANSYSNTVSIISNGLLLTTTGVGEHPNGIAYNPVNGRVYVVNRGTAATSSTVSVISDTTVIATVTLGTGYDEYLGVHPKDAITLQGNNYRGGTDIVTVDSTTGYVYVSNWGANTVSVISGTTLLATLPVGANPNSIVYNPVTGLVYVANTGSDTVTVIQGTHVVQTVPVGHYPIDLAADTHSGLVYAVNRYSDTLSIIRCEDNQPEKRVLGHYMTWYKTPITYTNPACVNPDARDEWRMWKMCEHDPDTITGTHGFRDIAAVHYPLIGPYDSADPKVIEYHLLQALAAEVDTFVIDYYGENDSGGVDEASLQVLQQVEEMNAQYGTNFKLALMYDEGALTGISSTLQFSKAISDVDYILHTYAGSPAYLWADGKPTLFYFPKGPVLSPTQLITVAKDFSLVYPDFSSAYVTMTNGSYAWVKAEPWMPDGSEWGESYLRWWYPELDSRAANVPTLTFGVGGIWAGFDDIGVGKEWLCADHRWIDRQGGQVYDWTWDILDEYNDAVGITRTLPVSWVQLVTLNDYMEGTTLFASVAVTGVDGADYGYGYGYQYVQQTEDHAQEFKELPADASVDIYVAQHIYNARWASETISTMPLINAALAAFHSGHYTEAMALADQAAGIPAPENVQAERSTDVITISWQDHPSATLVSGHRIYYGLESGNYISSTVAPSGSSATLTGLLPGATYYVVVTTLGTAHPCEAWYVSESWPSDEVIVQPGPAGVVISGPTMGVLSTSYTFTAAVTSTVGAAILPLTYTWEATGQVIPIIHTDGGLTDTIAFTWAVSGTQIITVTAMNPSGAASSTHVIVINVPLSGVTIEGPTQGYTNTVYAFTAIISPSTATRPITYTWTPTPTLAPITATATYSWTITGLKNITVVAINPAGIPVSATHTICIGWCVYLPAVFKNASSQYSHDNPYRVAHRRAQR